MPWRGSGVSSVDFPKSEERRRRAPVRSFVPETSRGTLAQNRARSRCPELDCLRGKLSPGTLATAEQRALALGVGADRVLIAASIITEDEYIRALAAWLHVPFERLELSRALCPLPDQQFIDAAQFGLLPLRVGDAFIYVVAPQVMTARRLVTGAHPLPRDRFRLTSPQRLRQFVLQHGGDALGERAAQALRIARPDLSAAVCPPPVRAAWLAGIASVVSAATVVPGPASVLVSALLALTFLAWTGLRLLGAATPWHSWRALRMPVHDLPIYTIIVALYDEAATVAGLITALRRLEYPREKLQIILVLENDDTATRDALARERLGPPFEILVAPDRGPRTKPKALNAALALARGTFTAVFDAEDRPAPDQLQRALDAFAAQGADVACVQARLTIDNTADGWLARLFTAEYAGLFDVLLPGLSERRRAPPPGGPARPFPA